jgi:hypothetical protein
MLDALPPLPEKEQHGMVLAPPIAVCVMLRVPVVAPSTALFKLTEAPLVVG